MGAAGWARNFVTLKQLSQSPPIAAARRLRPSGVTRSPRGGCMHKLAMVLMLCAVAARAWAGGDEDVHFAGGTVTQLKAGAVGALDLSSGTVLRFASSTGALEIPYTAIDSWEH